MLELRKKGNKHWLLIDEEIGEFTPSKFTINRLNNVINIVYFNNLKSKEYNISDCYIFDIDDTSGFNTSNGVAFMDKLEELNCPCFQKDETIIIGGVIDISGKLDKVSTTGVERAYIINADGSQGTKATSEFGGGETTSSIQTKRPLKTVNGESLEGSGNIQIDYNDLDNLPTIPTIITNHSGLTLDDGTNPHGTTKADVGLGNVPNLNTTNAVNNEHTHSNKTVLDNTTESFTSALKNAYNSAVSWITTNGTNLINHLTNYSNPHNVTKSQVGLGNVDNTSDVDKPISTATQTALNNLVTLNTTQTVTGNKQFDNVRLIKKVLTGVYPTTSGGNFYMGGTGGHDVFDFYSIDGSDSDGYGTVQIYSNPEEGNQIYHKSLDNQQSSILNINYVDTYLKHIFGGQRTSLYVNGITDKIIIEGTQNKYAALGTSLITGTKNFEFPDKNGTLALSSDIIASAENKVDKNTTAGVERVWVYGTNGIGSEKPTSEFKDVLEFANFASFPTIGESGKIYIDLFYNLQYRWTGSAYVQIGGINQDLYPIKYWYQATGAGVIQTYGTNPMAFQGAQSDVTLNGLSYRKIVSTATAGTTIFAREALFSRVLSNKGFKFLLRFRIADASTISDVRGFHGLQVISGFGNADISANTQVMCGIGCDGTEQTFHIVSRQVVSGTLVKIDTGFSKTLNHEYLLTQERLPNSNNVVFTLKNLTSLAEFTSTVVNNSSNLTIVNHRNNNASSISCGFQIQRQELNLSE